MVAGLPTICFPPWLVPTRFGPIADIREANYDTRSNRILLDLAKMAQSSDDFYDDMAAAYHLIFADWNVTIERQQAVLSKLLPPPAAAGTELDCD